ncbi:signal peptidase I [Alkalibacillus haloalkaliphilus]|uniref:signal peptidase I n=1 Tax=Alkalibacillus haloalkaliphilus TaxID=94136 RepID=UPI0002F5CE3F|nr:signal peptidase I [Alkalibacillus haloalkaliphilus]
MIKKIVKWIFNSLLIILLFIYLLAFSNLIQSDQQETTSILSFDILNVLSGSMEPHLSPGDIIIIRNDSEVKEGDVITFQGKQNNLVTHRVIGVFEKNGITHYETKGDANKTPDRQYVSNEEVIGKLSLSIPKAGYILDFLKGPFGVFTLSMILLTSFGYSPIKKLLLTESENKTKGGELKN